MNRIASLLLHAELRYNELRVAILTSDTAPKNYRQYAHSLSIMTNWGTLTQLNKQGARS